MNTSKNKPRRAIAVLGAVIVATATFAGPVGIVAAADDGATPTIEETTASPSREERAAGRAETRNTRQAARDAIRTWLDARRGLTKARAASVREARATMRAALAAADSAEERRAAKEAFKQALAAAKAAYESGVSALGPRPTMPGR